MIWLEESNTNYRILAIQPIIYPLNDFWNVKWFILGDKKNIHINL